LNRISGFLIKMLTSLILWAHFGQNAG